MELTRFDSGLTTGLKGLLVEGPHHARNQPTDRLDQTKRGFTFSTATLACKKGTTPLGTFHPIKDLGLTHTACMG